MAAIAALNACRADHRPIRDVQFKSSGGYTIGATLYVPEFVHPPGLILLPMAATTRDSWADFAKSARASGYLSMAIDLRGHGQSKSSTTARANPSTFDAADWLAILDDVAGAKQKLIESGADPDRIAIVGASIGANLALHYAANDPAIHAVVLVSPGDDYHGVGVQDAMQKFHGRPLMIIAALNDSVSARCVQGLDAAAKEYCETRLYPGTAHGTELLTAQPVAGDQIIMWLDHIFGRLQDSQK